MFPEDRRKAILERVRVIPCIEHFGLEALEFDEGFCRIRARHDRRADGVFPFFHGGMLAAVADCAAWFAIVTVTGPDEPMVTSDLHVRYLAPCDGDVIAEARTIKVGRTLCPTRVELFDRNGLHVASATVCYARIAPGGARSG
jgi:uncharacterized protein (TIGR00369 family)